MGKHMDFSGYDPISLIMALERVSFPEAVERLSRRLRPWPAATATLIRGKATVSNYFGA